MKFPESFGLFFTMLNFCVRMRSKHDSVKTLNSIEFKLGINVKSLPHDLHSIGLLILLKGSKIILIDYVLFIRIKVHVSIVE